MAEYSRKQEALDYHAHPSPGNWGSRSPSLSPPTANCRWPIRRASPSRSRRSATTRKTPTATPPRATWSRSSPTAPPYSAWATWARSRASRSWKARRCCSRNSPMSTCSISKSMPSDPRTSSRPSTRIAPDLWRHQSRGHRRPALLRDRTDADRAPGHPGVPRRPARHRDHRRGRPDQRPRTTGQDTGRRQDRVHGRRRGGHRIDAPAARNGGFSSKTSSCATARA